jgi:hypothetical protein
MHVCTLQEENVGFLTQKVAAHDMCDGNFVISFITMYNVWLFIVAYITLKWQLQEFAWWFLSAFFSSPHFDN